MRIAESIQELDSFLEETKFQSQFSLRGITINDQEEWCIKNGILRHQSGGFFQVCGSRDLLTHEEHLVLYQPQGAFNGLLIHKNVETIYVLIQARVEPGNSNICQFGPTIQSTPANYLRLHKGKKTPYLEMFMGYDMRANPIHLSHQLDIGKRYYQKSKTLSYVLSDELLDTEENMIWVSLEMLSETLERDNFLNTDLRSMLGIFDWDGFTFNCPLNGASSSLIKLKSVYRKSSSTNARLVPLTDLTKWVVTEKGVEDIGDTGLSVKIYHTICGNREVGHWSQPLYCCEGEGLVVLIIREKGFENFEFLLSIDTEFGVSGEKVLSTSCNIYPEEERTCWKVEGKVVKEIVQSEEGGRFLTNINRYQVILLDSDFEISENQFWVSVDDFKLLLNSSNTMSIQLRCMASLVLNYTNKMISKRALQ